ncbi:hypothetical protein [Lysinibacillus piscis]|uniref:Uncharacterized protein n=1 Tax=Lysinibacillus piscis TaxID=2518931 RepID=A0ABQ5NKU4_9BACI|nr:hypothetical protein [Lysinibacillus sp. KH24]GLC88977.1 hypothetical protein LYSBPC_21040 [Lysinibacillus sp. KH24]
MESLIRKNHALQKKDDVALVVYAEAEAPLQITYYSMGQSTL